MDICFFSLCGIFFPSFSQVIHQQKHYIFSRAIGVAFRFFFLLVCFSIKPVMKYYFTGKGEGSSFFRVKGSHWIILTVKQFLDGFLRGKKKKSLAVCSAFTLWRPGMSTHSLRHICMRTHTRPRKHATGAGILIELSETLTGLDSASLSETVKVAAGSGGAFPHPSWPFLDSYPLPQAAILLGVCTGKN